MISDENERVGKAEWAEAGRQRYLRSLVDNADIEVAFSEDGSARRMR